MHNFDDLIYRSTAFTLSALEDLNSKLIMELQTSASTIAIKNLQMIQLQKVIIAIGMFSLFESILQKGLECKDGFKEASKILQNCLKTELDERFNTYLKAINVLKHGRGNSYKMLISKSDSLPFRIKMPDENFFNEGDISEIYTLIEVNDEFILNCAELIEQVSKEIRIEFPDYNF